MSVGSVEIVPCPTELAKDALALVLSELAPAERRGLAAAARGGSTYPNDTIEGLVVAIRNADLLDAAWGQCQPGNTAIFWPPQGLVGPGLEIARQLTGAVAQTLDDLGVRMTQVLLPNRSAAIVPTLEAAGFQYLAELQYLAWEAAPVPKPAALEFEPYCESQQERWTHLVEATYALTQDCPAMNGKRPMHEVMEGYRGTGAYRPENWLFVRAAGEDVGVLLLADHEAVQYWELVYMGLVPEVRGRAWGGEIVRQAQRMASKAGVERLLVAVDAANAPALAMYRNMGFAAWDQRTVFVRFGEADASRGNV